MILESGCKSLKGFISGTWQIADHTISLQKKQFKDAVKANYVLSVNGIDYFFARDNVSITLSFKDEGIENIKVDGVTKDMGTNLNLASESQAVTRKLYCVFTLSLFYD